MKVVCVKTDLHVSKVKEVLVNSSLYVCSQPAVTCGLQGGAQTLSTIHALPLLPPMRHKVSHASPCPLHTDSWLSVIYLLLHPLSFEELKIFFLLFGSFACSLFDLGNAVALWLHYIFILFCQRFLDCCSLVFPLFYLIWCYTTSFVLDLEPFHRFSAVLE